MSDHLLQVYKAHIVAAYQRGIEDASSYAEIIRRGNHNETYHRRNKIAALAAGLVDHDRALTGRLRLEHERGN